MERRGCNLREGSAGSGCPELSLLLLLLLSAAAPCSCLLVATFIKQPETHRFELGRFPFFICRPSPYQRRLFVFLAP